MATKKPLTPYVYNLLGYLDVDFSGHNRQQITLSLVHARVVMILGTRNEINYDIFAIITLAYGYPKPLKTQLYGNRSKLLSLEVMSLTTSLNVKFDQRMRKYIVTSRSFPSLSLWLSCVTLSCQGKKGHLNQPKKTEAPTVMATGGNDPMHLASSSTPASATTRAIIQRLTTSSSPLNDANRLMTVDHLKVLLSVDLELKGT